MGPGFFRLVGLPILAIALVGAGRPATPKEEMRFGVEAAQRGLWREAIFRWERALKRDPQNARLRNNLAVAYESLGQNDRALQEYKEALRLDPHNREIRDNYESFRELHKNLEEGVPGPEESAPTEAAP